MAFVYLIRSGLWLKAGYTVDLDRRYLEYLHHNPEASKELQKAMGFIGELAPDNIFSLPTGIESFWRV